MFFRCCCCRRRKTYTTTPVGYSPDTPTKRPVPITFTIPVIQPKPITTNLCNNNIETKPAEVVVVEPKLSTTNLVPILNGGSALSNFNPEKSTVNFQKNSGNEDKPIPEPPEIISNVSEVPVHEEILTNSSLTSVNITNRNSNLSVQSTIVPSTFTTTITTETSLISSRDKSVSQSVHNSIENSETPVYQATVESIASTLNSLEDTALLNRQPAKSREESASQLTQTTTEPTQVQENQVIKELQTVIVTAPKPSGIAVISPTENQLNLIDSQSRDTFAVVSSINPENTQNLSNLDSQDLSKVSSINKEVTTHVAPDPSDQPSVIPEHAKDQIQTNDMIKISVEVDNSDIVGTVPLNIRSSISSQPPRPQQIKEENEQNSDSSDASDDQTPGNTSAVTFAPEPPQLRREGIREAVTVDPEKEIPHYSKADEDISHIKNAIALNDFLANVLTEESLNKVIGAMKERKISRGEVIIEEGEPGNNMYVSSRGTYEVYVKKKLYSTFSDKRVFGELAILYNSKRMATIRAVTDGKVWLLQRSVYQQILVQSAIKDFEQTLSFLQNVPLVNKLNDDSLSTIANLFKKEFFKTDTVIVEEGEPGDKFYIIRAGSVTITKKNEGKVSELGQGAFFGERALLRDDVRQATVLANAPGVECLTLTRPEFKNHFNDIISIPQKQEAADTRISVNREEKSVPPNKYSNITLEELEKRATLGVGGFGRVELVQHKNNLKLTFALKYLKKIDMVQQDQVEHVFNEKDIQINCDSIFIVRLYKTFQDSKYLYFLMESCLGGDLWTYLQKRKGRMVPEIHARFYAACVLEAIAYLHERNYIYRDLKPENLLIDARGYIKLTDFGFAKSLKTASKTYTFAGTPEYVAPEIIYNKGHDKSIDYWAFGILIFELLVGKSPFRTDDHTNMMTYNRILRGITSVTFPPHVTKSATNLIKSLCRPLPTDRLGNQKSGIQDIRVQNFFQGFDWEKLRNQSMKPPFVPKLNSNIDTKYFEKFSDDDDIPPQDETTTFKGF